MNNYRILRPFVKGMFTKLGCRYETTVNGWVEITEVISNLKFRVRFEDTGFEKIADIRNITSGRVKDDSISRRKLKDKETESKFCVYVHKDATGVIRYVGEGTLVRAYSKSRTDQPMWQALFKDNPPTVEIVAQGLTKTAAEDLEILIRRLHENTIINDPYATKKVHKLDFEEISEVVYYDESSPTSLRWHFRMNNNALPQSPAGHNRKDGNYSYVEINKVSYSVHRVVWLLNHGNIPDDVMVDHVDGNRQNNKISNLRLTNAKLNSHNKLHPIPKSGYRNIRSEPNKVKGAVFTVRWHPKDDNNRQWKFFREAEYGSAETAFRAAYTFRDQLIESGALTPRIKEGEVPID